MSGEQEQSDSKASGLKFFVFVWILITMWMSYEYLILNRVAKAPSLLLYLNKQKILLPSQPLRPNAGSTFSFYLGWIGFSLILMTNFYIWRKRRPSEKQVNMKSWLNFHIFCGLLGPTIIVFHTNFKIGGLVAISFWSMMVSVASGIIGRYFYLQLLMRRVDLKLQIKRQDHEFNELLRIQSAAGRLSTVHELVNMKRQVLGVAGLQPNPQQDPSLVLILANSIVSDLRLAFFSPRLPTVAHNQVFKHIKAYAVARRKLATMDYYRQMMGYWHAFHTPFAFFMYIVTSIHIVVALVFRVNH